MVNVPAHKNVFSFNHMNKLWILINSLNFLRLNTTLFFFYLVDFAMSWGEYDIH
jgi:hypothetical protein